MAEFHTTATRASLGTTSFNSCTRLPSSSGPETVNPVMLPPGREKLGTSPAATGLPLDAKTTGIVLVARLAASEPGVPVVTITSGLSRTNSVAKAERRLSPPLRPTEIDREGAALDMTQFE